MKKKDEIQIAWELWHLIFKISDFIWDQYEDEFVDIYLKEEENKYLNSISKEYKKPTE